MGCVWVECRKSHGGSNKYRSDTRLQGHWVFNSLPNDILVARVLERGRHLRQASTDDQKPGVPAFERILTGIQQGMSFMGKK